MNQGPKDSWIDLGLVSAKSGRSYKVRLLRHDLQPGGGRISPAPQVLATRAAVSPRGSHKLDYAHNLWGISLEESTHGGLIKISRILDGSIASKPCGVTSNGQTTRFCVCLSLKCSALSAAPTATIPCGVFSSLKASLRLQKAL